MFAIHRTETFAAWLSGLKDRRAAARIASRLLRAEDGNLGDVKAVGEGISEMRRLRTGLQNLFHSARICGDRASLRWRQEHATAPKRLAQKWKERDK
jgi:putative component of toxin-antitoxin plasmid stabilization module